MSPPDSRHQARTVITDYHGRHTLFCSHGGNGEILGLFSISKLFRCFWLLMSVSTKVQNLDEMSNLPAIVTVGRCGAHAGSVLHLPGIHTYMQSQIYSILTAATRHTTLPIITSQEGRFRAILSRYDTMQALNCSN